MEGIVVFQFKTTKGYSAVRNMRKALVFNSYFSYGATVGMIRKY